MKLRLLALPALALLGLSLTACDSAKDDSETATFEGNWKLSAISDNNGASKTPQDLTAAFNQVVTDLGFVFDDGNYTLSVDYTAAANQAGRVDLTGDKALKGTYSVSETNKTITLQVPFGGGLIPVAFGYTITSENQIQLTAGTPATNAINQVLQPTTAYRSDLYFTVIRR